MDRTRIRLQTDRRTDGRTDGHTDRRTDGQVQTNIPPLQLRCAGGITCAGGIIKLRK